MALATATITYDIADLTGVDFDSRRTKVWVTTNIPDGTIADTVGNQVRIGDGRGSLADDGTGSVTVWVPGTGSNPASWQTTLHVDYQPRSGGRTVRNFGPFTITTSADLADLVAEQSIPPAAIGGDAAVAGFVNSPTSATIAALSASFVATAPPPSPLGAAVDTAKIQALMDAASAAGGGVVQLQAGEYLTTGLYERSYVTLRGHGPAATRLKLNNGANADVLSSDNFATVTGTTSSAGVFRFRVEGLTLDGNRTNQTGTSWCFRIYGAAYEMQSVVLFRGRTGGAWTEWSTSATTPLTPAWMEAHWTDVRIIDWGTYGLVHKGPHDSTFLNLKIVSFAPNGSSGSIGLWQSDNTGGDEFTNVHVWGSMGTAAQLEHSASIADCYFEGGAFAQLKALGSNITGSAKLFNANGASDTCLQVGDATHPVTGLNLSLFIDSRVAGSTPVGFVNSGGGNRIRATWVKSATTSIFGTTVPAATDDIDITCSDSSAYSHRSADRRQTAFFASGVLAETFDRTTGQMQGQAALTSGRTTYQAIFLRAGTLVSSISFGAGGTAAAGLTHCFFTLADANVNKLAVTADDVTGWNAFSRKTLTLSAPYRIPTTGIYYLGVTVVATTVPNIAGFPTYPSVGGGTPKLCGRDDTHTTLTDPTSAPASGSPLVDVSLVLYAQVG